MPDLFVAHPKKQSTKDTSHQKPSHSPHHRVAKLKKVPVLASFTEYPENLKFENQEADEKIHLFLRRHFITNFRWILFSIIGLLMPLGIYLLLPTLDTLNLSLPGNYIFILTLFYYLIFIGYAFINFTTWYYNVGIITNLRVIDIDLAYITNKNVAATGIIDIVDVEYGQSGFIENFFDYGNVHMQTEGLKANFEFLDVPKPAKTTDIISDLMRQEKSE